MRYPSPPNNSVEALRQAFQEMVDIVSKHVETTVTKVVSRGGSAGGGVSTGGSSNSSKMSLSMPSDFSVYGSLGGYHVVYAQTPTGTGRFVFSNSPTLTGIPLGPTASLDTDTEQLATTAFVLGQITNTYSGPSSTLAVSQKGVTDGLATKIAATDVIQQPLTGYTGASGVSATDSILGAFEKLAALTGSTGGSSTYTNATPVPVAVGGVGAGETFSSETTTQVFDRLFYPTLYPSFTNPSSLFSLAESGYREIGEVIATLHFSASFSRGSISPAYGTSGYRSGLPNHYNYTGTGLGTKASISLSDTETVSSYTVLTGAQSWTESVSYDIGEQPKDSKGGNYSTPLSAGTSATQTQTITGVYPWYATSVGIATLTKQALTSMSSAYVQVTMIAEDGVNKQSACFPVAWSAITSLKQYNSLAGTWDAIDIASFTVSDTTETIQGNVVNYKLWTYNGPTIGSRQLRFYS